MAYLVLDLDKTTFYGFLGPKTEDFDIDPFHDMYPLSQPGTLMNGKFKANIELINMEEISQLVENACIKHDGIIVLTAGQWDATILDLLADSLHISPRAANILRKSYFHSPLTDAALHGLPFQQIREMPKSDRLEKIIEHRPNLKGKHFVALDDDIDHIEAYKKMRNVTPVFATTHLPDKSFYKVAEDSLFAAKTNERALYPSNNYNGRIKVKFAKASFFPSAEKRKLTDDENIAPDPKRFKKD